MDGKTRGEKRFILASFVMLSIATVLLLAITVDFLSTPEVQRQLAAWIQGLPSRQAAAPRAWSEAQIHAAAVATVEAMVAQRPRTRAASLGTTAAAALYQGPYWAASAPEESETGPEKAVFIPPENASGKLIIPALGIEQALERVPVRDGMWDLDSLGDRVGWLETTGTYPGGPLAITIAGHVTLPYPGGDGPFLRLDELRDGDEVLYRTDSATYVYQVAGRRAVPPEAVENLYLPDGNRLILVTCTGYNPLERKYDRRLLVEAVLVRTEPLMLQ